MKINILDSTKKKRFLEGVSYLGNFKTNNLFIGTGAESVRVYSGHLHVDDILKIWRNFPIEGVGLHFGKVTVDKKGRKESRLGIDALHLMKSQITKNIVELTKEQADSWFRGNNVELNEEQKIKYNDTKEFVAVKFENDFIGTAKLTEQKILLSFLPKERRIKN